MLLDACHELTEIQALLLSVVDILALDVRAVLLEYGLVLRPSLILVHFSPKLSHRLV